MSRICVGLHYEIGIVVWIVCGQKRADVLRKVFTYPFAWHEHRNSGSVVALEAWQQLLSVSSARVSSHRQEKARVMQEQNGHGD
jgi:hypothetical protein